MSDQDTRKQIERIDTLIQQFDQLNDADTRAAAAELVQAVMDLHARSLATIVEIIAKHENAGRILAELSDDEAVSGLLILYGLHPTAFAGRVRSAIAKLEPFLQSHQANLEVDSLNDGAVRLRLIAGNHGCHSSPAEIKQFVADTIVGAAPDLNELTIEVVSPEATPVFVPLQGLAKPKAVTNPEPVAAI